MQAKPFAGSCKVPCSNCPFRNDLPRYNKGWLGRANAKGKVRDVIDGNMNFRCHKDTSLLCAGALHLQRKLYGYFPSIELRLLAYWGYFNKLSGKDKVFNSRRAFVNFHTTQHETKRKEIKHATFSKGRLLLAQGGKRNWSGKLPRASS